MMTDTWKRPKKQASNRQANNGFEMGCEPIYGPPRCDGAALWWLSSQCDDQILPLIVHGSRNECNLQPHCIKIMWRVNDRGNCLRKMLPSTIGLMDGKLITGDQTWTCGHHNISSVRCLKAEFLCHCREGLLHITGHFLYAFPDRILVEIFDQHEV